MRMSRPLARLVLLAAAATLLTPAAAAQAAAAAPLEGLPQFDHVVVLVEENEDAAVTFGPDSPATYLNELRAEGVFLPNYFGTGHASLDNYISMISGQEGNGATNGDCLGLSLYACVQTVDAGPSTTPGRHLGDQLEEAGLSWANYADGGTPAAPIGDCFHSPYSATDPSPDLYQGNSRTAPAYDYADRHVPFLYFDNVVGDQTRCEAHVRGYQRFAGDLVADTLPAFSLITPDTCHDGHDNPCSDGSPGGLVSADAWLRQEVPALKAYLAAHNGLLIINFDEGGFSAGGASSGTCTTCAGAGAGGRTGAVLISPRLPQGATVTTGYDHFSLLRTIESSFGISEHLNQAGVAAPMLAAFAGTTADGPAPVVPEAPMAVLLPLLGLGVGVAAVVLRRRSRVTG